MAGFATAAAKGCIERIRTGPALPALLLLSLTLKFALLWHTGVVNIDAARYLVAAQKIAEGSFLEALAIERLPFYPLLIASLHFFVPHWELAGQLTSLSALVLTLIPLYLLTRDLFDEQAAFWAGLAFALAPLPNKHAVEVLRDPIYLLFLACAVWCCSRAIVSRKWTFFAAAAAFSLLALLFRIEAVFLPAVFLLVTVLIAVKRRRERSTLAQGMAILAVPPFVLAAVLLFAFTAGGEVAAGLEEMRRHLIGMYNLDFLGNYQRIYVQLKELEQTLPGWKGTAGFAETARHYLPLIYLLGLAEAIARNLFPPLLLPLIAGFATRISWRREHLLVLLVAGTYFLVAFFFLLQHNFISKRYVLAPALLLTPWVGAGLARFWIWARSCRWPRLATAVLLILVCLPPAWKSLERRANQDRTVKVAGEWLAAQAELQQATILTTDERVPYYAGRGRDFLSHPDRDYEGMKQRAIESNIDLLVIEVSKKDRAKVPELEKFTLFAEFSGVKNVVLIFRKHL